jgi:hypothetical protein
VVVTTPGTKGSDSQEDKTELSWWQPGARAAKAGNHLYTVSGISREK